MRVLPPLLVLMCLVSGGGAQTPDMTGDYSGVLGPLHLKLHLKMAAGQALEATLDSADQGAMGLACANVRLEHNKLTFDVPSVHGKWSGTVSDDGATLTGNWSQGSELPLVFQRDKPFLAASKSSRVDGIWLGTLAAGDAKLRLQVQIKSDSAGREYCSLDSLDQGAAGLPCDNIQFDGSHFSFDVPTVHGHWSGALSDDNNQLKGSWSQGSELPLNLTRQSAALAPEKPKAPKVNAAMPPVAMRQLKAVLDRDLAVALKDGALAPAGKGGIVIGLLDHGDRQILTYGAAQQNSIFEIGSISKTFTGLILAQMVEQKKVTFDEPVRDLLPPGTVAKPQGVEITLLDLATQHSGLPRMPDNFHPANPEDPYADYGAQNLYEYIGKHGLAKPSNAPFAYSNLGLGLLGQALSNRAAMPYPELLKDEVTGPLNLNDTAIKLSPEQQARFIEGHDAQHHPAHAWSIDALAGAGGIRSSANDMLTYLDAQLHPESAPAPLNGALKLSHQLRADVGPGLKIALAWLYDSETGNYWHNGATGGYSSYSFFNPKDGRAVVVLFNATVGPGGSFADRVAQDIVERLHGKPAISLVD